MDFINLLNSNSGAIQAISTTVLVLITVWYAFTTQQMARIMKKQTTPKIVIENISIGSQFKEQWFLKGNFQNGYSFKVKSIFDIRNEGNGSGSLYKPSLVVKLKERFEILCPKTKDYESYNIEDRGNMRTWDTRTINYGGSIFLAGGASEKIELEYVFRVESEEQLAFIKEIQANQDLIEYTLKTKDNLGNEYSLFVKDIFKEREFGIS